MVGHGASSSVTAASCVPRAEELVLIPQCWTSELTELQERWKPTGCCYDYRSLCIIRVFLKIFMNWKWCIPCKTRVEDSAVLIWRYFAGVRTDPVVSQGWWVNADPCVPLLVKCITFRAWPPAGDMINYSVTAIFILKNQIPS